MQKICLIRTSVSSLDEANIVASGLMHGRRVACVQISGPGKSVYGWKGKLEEAEEYYLSIKTTLALCVDVIDWLKQHHPYELPEIVWRACNATDAYADWVQAEVQSNHGRHAAST